MPKKRTRNCYDEEETKRVFVDNDDVRVTLRDLFEVVEKVSHLTPKAARVVFDHLPVRCRKDTIHLQVFHDNGKNQRTYKALNLAPSDDMRDFARWADCVLKALLVARALDPQDFVNPRGSRDGDLPVPPHLTQLLYK